MGLQYNPTEAGGAKPLLRDFLSPDVKNLPPRSLANEVPGKSFAS